MIYNAGERNSQFGVEETQRFAAARGLELKLLAIANPGEVADAASVLAETVDAFYVGSDNTVVSALAGLLKVASEAKVPVIASDIGSVEQGAIAALSVDYRKLGRRAGQLVADVLDGATPGEIPNEIFAGDSLVINMKTAAAEGIDLPPSLVARANVVLE
jgi:putative ABC transport system substrate-binding protein